MSNPTHDIDENDEAAIRPGASPETLAALNAKLDGKKGKLFWKGVEELADTEEFQQWVADEFPNRSTLLQVDRRKFLTISGAALAMSGLTGCRFLPQTKAVPYVRSPEEMIVGKSLVYSSTLTRGGYGLGVLVESREGRPIKIEGNPNHPASLGATDVWGQAEILNLYDPDRSQDVKTNDETASWDQFWGAARQALAGSGAGGAGIALLTETVTSPTLIALIRQFQAKYPASRWYQYEPVNRDNVYAGTTAAFGRALHPVYRFKAARVIVSLDSDFLLTDGTDYSNVRYAKDFSDGRRVRAARPRMNRLYAFESSYTITGAMADHRFPMKPSQIEGVARALHTALTGGVGDVTGTGVPPGAFAAMVRDIQANRGAALVVAGDTQPAAVHALAHAINVALGAVGTTVTYTVPAEVNPGGQTDGLRQLVDSINGGTVKTLLILGGNPVYNAPHDLGLNPQNVKDSPLLKVPFRVHLSQYEDETSRFCNWHLPEAHPLEVWGDARAFDGTASLIQPLIQPLYEGRAAIEVLAQLVDQPMPSYDLVANYWQRFGGAPAGGAAAGTTGVNAFASWWERVLVRGVIPGTAAPAVTPTLAAGFSPAALPAPAAPSGRIEVAFRPDPTLWDGRYANNSWLQEVPKPITTITWDNTAQMSPRTAKELGIITDVSDNDARDIAQVTGKRLVTISANGAKVDLPVWVLPGQPDGVVTVHLGYGRTGAGQVGNAQGFDTYVLRNSATMGYAGGDVTATGVRYDVSTTQAHHTMRGINEDRNRDVVRAGSLTEFVAKKGRLIESEHEIRIPEATAFPAGHGSAAQGDRGEGHGSEGQHEERQFTRIDGALGQEPNLEGHNHTITEEDEVIADAYRKEWKYTSKAMSNDKGWPSLYPEFSNRDFNAWGMGIDMSTCIGCNACVIACQSENNIPTVGKEQVGKGREMHWLRIDHYYEGDSLDNVESHFQPMMCVHCEKAPCEPVCPVAATVHSHEGLNQMIYNRCIGTRYCSNNCPYKVRRFNFLKWTAGVGGPTTLNYELPVLKMLANPEVTVRGRGIMEKCTYCVQRINNVRIEAKKEQREIRDGEIVTACQQVCPTQAIVFGDLNNKDAEVSRWRREPHDYLLLSELNTRPRTSYLARIKNPNPEIVAAGGPAAGENTGERHG
jgi:molybdopterin-containing oxidoreductase family iron-sulfur binding subunit